MCSSAYMSGCSAHVSEAFCFDGHDERWWRGKTEGNFRCIATGEVRAVKIHVGTWGWEEMTKERSTEVTMLALQVSV